MFVTEPDEQGGMKKGHELPFRYGMLLPASRAWTRWRPWRAGAPRAASC